MPIHDEWVLRQAPRVPSGYAPPLPEPLRSVLLRRGITDSTLYSRFSSPSIADLHDGRLIAGMSVALARIGEAIRKREKILIYGDYDVDGVTSIVLLQTVLRIVGADVDFVVPHRLVDGYGLKIEVIERVLAESDVRLVITVDCGISSVEPVQAAIARGIDVIVTDHHLPPDLLPEAAAVLNPRTEGCEYPYEDLAGVGVAFKLACELIGEHGKSTSIESLLKIAAIGTVADVAPLTGENRAITRLGLDGLADPRNPGLRALLRQLGLLGKKLKSSDVGFRIGPRINAAGRLASADTAIRLFAAKSEDEAFPIVQELERLNTQRREIERQVLREAESQIDPGHLPDFIVVAGRGWHQGVVGLVAARLMQKHHRPALVVTSIGGRCVGSGRSIAGISLHEHLASMRDLFLSFGGHDAACGFSLEEAKVEELRTRLQKRGSSLGRDSFRRSATVDAILEIGALDRTFFDDHQMLEPFGAANSKPAFLFENVASTSTREFSEGCFEVALRDPSGEIAAVIWPSSAWQLDALRRTSRCSIVAEVEEDRYSKSGMRLEIIDIAPAGSEPLRNETAPAAVSY